MDAVVRCAVAVANRGHYSGGVLLATVQLHGTGSLGGRTGNSVSMVTHHIGSIGARPCSSVPGDGAHVCATAGRSFQMAGWTRGFGAIDKIYINTIINFSFLLFQLFQPGKM